MTSGELVVLRRRLLFWTEITDLLIRQLISEAFFHRYIVKTCAWRISALTQLSPAWQRSISALRLRACPYDHLPFSLFTHKNPSYTYSETLLSAFVLTGRKRYFGNNNRETLSGQGLRLQQQSTGWTFCLFKLKDKKQRLIIIVMIIIFFSD